MWGRSYIRMTLYKYNKVYGSNAMWISSDKESLVCWKNSNYNNHIINY